MKLEEYKCDECGLTIYAKESPHKKECGDSIDEGICPLSYDNDCDGLLRLTGKTITIPDSKEAQDG